MLATIKTIGLPTPDHIGVIVKDAKKTADFLSATLGVGPWDIFEFAPKKQDLFVGQAFIIKVGLARMGDTNMELIEPLTRGSLWANFLEKNGEGPQHMAFNVKNYQDMVASMKKQGVKAVVGGSGPKKFGAKPWCYFNVNPGGLYIELMDNFGTFSE